MVQRRARAYHRGVAEIVYLSAEQSPPERDVWLLLDEDQDGLFTTRSQHITGSVMRHDHPGGKWPLKEAIEKAQVDAVEYRIPTIYVRRADA